MNKVKKFLKVSMLQMQSKTTHQDNIKSLETAAQKAKNADLLVLPEYSGLLDKDVAEARKSITTKTRDPFIKACCYLAKAHNLWVHIGSTPIKSGKKILNHSALINNHGFIVAAYDKIHMFDIFPVDRKPIIESKHYKHGENAVLIDTPWGGWGMSVCYDLRFPHLYRSYAQNDAKVLFIPSAFTLYAGDAHWEVLLRARAIETGAWVIAAAQVGKHQDGRETYGHSLIVNPWGKVITDLGGSKPGQINISIDLDEVEHARSMIPSAKNEQTFGFKHIHS
jgi:deaminated glutathione amidase